VQIPKVVAPAFGDLRVGGRYRLAGAIRGPDGAPLYGPSLAAGLDVTFPTSTRGSFLGDEYPTAVPSILGEWRAGVWRVLVNAGARLRKTATIEVSEIDPVGLGPTGRIVPIFTAGSEFFLAVGGEWRPLPGWRDRLGVIAEILASSDWKLADTDATHRRLGILAGGRIAIGKGFSALAAAGGEVGTGWGSASYRILGALRWSPEVTPIDTDEDGVADVADACPGDKEDRDGFEDDDGCPDPDNDRDGIADAKDACPLRAEDIDGFQDEDGCPDLDNDNDGISDRDDQCPNVAEDLDGFEDDDGCPDRDDDEDGIADGADLCPRRPETVNGFEDDDGCPDIAPPARVEIGSDRVIVNEKIRFDLGSDRVSTESRAVLAEVGALLKRHQEISRVEIQGHTDMLGSAADNLRLSQARADSVRRWLVENGGVGAPRLVAKGYGGSSPIAPNDTAESRSRNRRIDFIILDRMAKELLAPEPPAKPQPPAPPPKPAPATRPAPARTPAKPGPSGR